MGPPRVSPGAPARSLVQTVRTQIRKTDYQKALLRMEALANPMSLRDYEISSASHDDLSALQDRGFEALNLCASATFMSLGFSWVGIEVLLETNLSSSRVLAFSDMESFGLDMAMALGVLDNHTRFLLPSAETKPASWKAWRDPIEIVVLENGMAGMCRKPPIPHVYTVIWRPVGHVTDTFA